MTRSRTPRGCGRARPGTEHAAECFATVAQALRDTFGRETSSTGSGERGPAARPHVHADAGTSAALATQFGNLAGDLFRVMARGGRVGETAWFNGGLFDELPLERPTSTRCWRRRTSTGSTSSARCSARRKRAQLGAHYTDRDKIMLIVEPVVIRPWAEWAAEKAEVAAELERAGAAKSLAVRPKRRNEAERRYNR